MNSLKQPFYKQHSRAKRLGIKFEFNYQEWVDWWVSNLGGNWRKLRGPHKHEYCMARFNDEGPYHPSNVKCITNAENKKEQKPPTKGEANYFAKLTKEQVIAIRSSKEKRRVLAEQHNVCVRTISRIKLRLYWKD